MITVVHDDLNDDDQVRTLIRFLNDASEDLDQVLYDRLDDMLDGIDDLIGIEIEDNGAITITRI